MQVDMNTKVWLKRDYICLFEINYLQNYLTKKQVPAVWHSVKILHLIMYKSSGKGSVFTQKNNKLHPLAM